jgi:hypothetical protein
MHVIENHICFWLMIDENDYNNDNVVVVVVAVAGY